MQVFKYCTVHVFNEPSLHTANYFAYIKLSQSLHTANYFAYIKLSQSLHTANYFAYIKLSHCSNGGSCEAGNIHVSTQQWVLSIKRLKTPDVLDK